MLEKLVISHGGGGGGCPLNEIFSKIINIFINPSFIVQIENATTSCTGSVIFFDTLTKLTDGKSHILRQHADAA